MKKTSIIDQPRTGKQENNENWDLLSLGPYHKALSEFIQNADTPITIALQGEWGSGKTSLMNALQYGLTEKENSPFLSIWINTWQYSMLSEPEMAVVDILRDIVLQLGKFSGKDGNTKREALKKISKISAIGLMNVLGRFGGVTNTGNELAAAFVKNAEEGTGKSLVSELKDEIEELIGEVLASKNNSAKKGILFFIDDLDRIDPPVAVKILELLKNIFDLEKCIFVLAIDYDVVIKGLKQKFGEMTAQNEREFRSFFDKIIQLPFSMPVASYKIDEFLINSLKSIEYLTEKEAEDRQLSAELTELAQWSVGYNPRSLKRLTNTLSLIRLISQATTKDDDNDFPKSKSINFALVCMQICYPAIYNALLLESDFKQWGDELAQKLNLPPLTEEELKKLKMQEKFNEEWEQALFRLCRRDYFLSSRVLDISRILNKISAMIPEEENAENIISSIIRLSAVTNVQSGEQKTTSEPVRFHQSHWLKMHRDRLCPVVNAMLGSWGKLYTEQKRVQSSISYKVSQENKHNRSDYVFKIDHDGKSFIVIWSKAFRLMTGAATGDYEAEEKEIGQAGVYRKIQTELFELKEKYLATHDMGQSFGPNSNSSAWIWFNFSYNSLEEAVSPEAIRKFAEFVVEYLKITDQFAQIADSSACGQFEKLVNFCRNNGVAPFANFGRWEKLTFVLNGMPYQENILSIDLILRRRGFTVQFFVRTGNAKIQEVCEKAGLAESFPKFDNNRVYNEVPFEEIDGFLKNTLSKLSALTSNG